MDGRLKYGIIGAGAMGRGHIESLEIVDGVKVVAAADPAPESLMATKAVCGGILLYEYYRQMYRRKLSMPLSLRRPMIPMRILSAMFSEPAFMFWEKSLLPIRWRAVIGLLMRF